MKEEINMETAIISSEVEQKINGLIEFCDSVKVVTIQTQDQYVQADGILSKIKKALYVVEDERKTAKDPFLQKGKEVDAWFGQKKNALDSLKIELQKSLINYEREAEQKRIEEQRKLDAEAERKRHEAEIAAQRERDKADELRKEAEEKAKTDRAAADALLVRAAAAETRADNKEIKASEIEAPIVQKELPKTNSFLRDNWKMKITDPVKLVQFCVSHNLLFLLAPIETACNNYAKIVKNTMQFEGAEIVNEQIRSSKGNIPI
jgi:hypothetical protein